MRRSRPGIGSELLPVALILIGLGGTLGLVVSLHRKVGAGRPAAHQVATAPAPSPAPVTPEPQAPAEPEEPPAPSPPVVVQPPPPPPPEDPTEKALDRLNSQTQEQLRAARAADARAASLETAIKAAAADAQRWRRREALVQGQVSRLTDKASQMEMEADSLAMERDALARELDATKAAVAKARARNGGYAVMPNKSANGTWQRPVMIECRDGQAILQPKGLTYSMLDLSGLMSARSNPFVVAVGRELINAHRTNSPDGAPVVPYIYFIIRPDGIRPYYEARGRLEPLGIAFGYELVEADWDIEFPDFDDLASWDGSASPGTGKPHRGGGSSSPALAGNGGRVTAPGNLAGAGNGNVSNPVAGAYGFVWPNSRTSNGSGQGTGPVNTWDRAGAGTSQARGGTGNGTGTGDVADSNGFVWPADRPGGVRGADGIWPTQPPALGGGGTGSRGPVPPLELAGGTGSSGGGNGLTGAAGAAGSQGVPGGGSAGAQSPIPPLEMADGSGGGGAGRAGSPLTSPGSGPGQSGLAGAPANPLRVLPGGASGPAQGTQAQGTTRGPQGLVPLGPDGLPRLDPPGLASGANGTGTPVDPTSLAGAPGNLPPSGNGLTSGAPGGPGGSKPLSPTVAPPPGWVRIDPERLARAVDGDYNDPDRPPAQPSSARPGSSGSGSSSSSSSSSSTGSPATGSASGGSSGSPPSGGPGIPSFGAGPASQGQKDDYRPKAISSRGWAPMLSRRIDVPLNLVVACGPTGVVVHPGGFRLSRAALAKDGSLRRDLETIVRNHELIDGSVHPVPRVQFLVEPGGSDTYNLARRQTVLSGLPWPVTIQVAGGQPASNVFPKERF